jgi:hypothetical protein
MVEQVLLFDVLIRATAGERAYTLRNYSLIRKEYL